MHMQSAAHTTSGVGHIAWGAGPIKRYAEGGDAQGGCLPLLWQRGPASITCWGASSSCPAASVVSPRGSVSKKCSQRGSRCCRRRWLEVLGHGGREDDLDRVGPGLLGRELGLDDREVLDREGVLGARLDVERERGSDEGRGARDVEVVAHVLGPDGLHAIPPVDLEVLEECGSQAEADHLLLVKRLSVRLVPLARREMAGLRGQRGRRARSRGSRRIWCRRLGLLDRLEEAEATRD
jgi:hypothetical protein